MIKNGMVNQSLKFKGVYSFNEPLQEKLNNIDNLKNLAKVSNVDTIRTTMKNNKFLPRNTLYATISSKKIDGDVVFGVDVLILPKDATNETVSKSVFESAQRSLGKMWGELAKHPVMEESKKTDSFFKAIFKKFTNMYKK